MWHLTYEAVPSLPVTNTSLKTHVIEVAGYRWLVYILIATPAGVRCDTLKHSSGCVVTRCLPFSCIMRKNLASLSPTANNLTHLILSVTFYSRPLRLIDIMRVSAIHQFIHQSVPSWKQSTSHNISCWVFSLHFTSSPIKISWSFIFTDGAIIPHHIMW